MHRRLPPTFRAALLAAAFCLSVGSPGHAEPRVWTNVDGREIKAELLDATPSSVKLNVGGKEFEIPLDKLNEADNAYVKKWLASKAEPAADPGASPGPMVFGGVAIEPARMNTFDLVLSSALSEEASKEAGDKITKVTIGLAVPAGFDPAKSWPVLAVSATSGGNGSSVGHMNSYWKVGTENGWVVVAADNASGRPDGDTSPFRYAILKGAFEEMKLRWPGSETWPIACGGNSGGAKCSGYVAAQMVRDGRPVIGIFMGGCNQDTASDSFNWYNRIPRKEFLKVPIFLSNGLEDKIAGDPYPKELSESMERTGFKAVRSERFNGGHGVHQEHIGEALSWFLEIAKKDQ